MRNTFKKSDQNQNLETSNLNNISNFSINTNTSFVSGKNKQHQKSLSSNIKINPNNEFINHQLEPEKFDEYMY